MFKINVQIILVLFLYIIPPIYLTILKILSLKLLSSFFLVNALIVFYLLKKNLARKYYLEYQIQAFQEKLNIQKDQNFKEQRNLVALQAKITRYNSLKEIVEEINKNFDLDYIADKLTSIAFSLISHDKGVCILHLVDNQTQKLSLFKTKKEDKELVIKAKEGDIFDHWVLKHTSPLLIEDAKRDFRFDLEKLKPEYLRPILSLISAPFISEYRFLGILRLDSQQTHLYSQNDLRFLVTICNLGAVALENSQLFKETQSLALHDGLTSLYTKGYFMEHLKEECIRSRRRNALFSLLMLDIDFFKNYNDKFGHTAGDTVLKNLSRVVVESLKDLKPIVSRFGGEEFCIILPGIDKKKAYTIACKLCKSIENEKIILRRQETCVTVSIGVATFPIDGNDENDLIMRTDMAMYEAKQKGRNRVCCI